MNEDDLTNYLETTHRAGKHFFPDQGGNPTISGESYNIIVDLFIAIRALVTEVRKLQAK